MPMFLSATSTNYHITLPIIPHTLAKCNDYKKEERYESI